MKKVVIKTVPTKASVKDFLNQIENPARRKDCLTLKALMQKVTGKKPVLWGDSLVGFGSMTQRYSTGQEVEWLQMGFASRKVAISIYMTCDLDSYTKDLEKLGKYKRGVGCLYIKSLADIDIRVLEKLLSTSMKKEKKITSPVSK